MTERSPDMHSYNPTANTKEKPLKRSTIKCTQSKSKVGSQQHRLAWNLQLAKRASLTGNSSGLVFFFSPFLHLLHVWNRSRQASSIPFSLPVLLFTSPTWQISTPAPQAPFLFPSYIHPYASVAAFGGAAQGTYCFNHSPLCFQKCICRPCKHDTFYHVWEKQTRTLEQNKDILQRWCCEKAFKQPNSFQSFLRQH